MSGIYSCATWGLTAKDQDSSCATSAEGIWTLIMSVNILIRLTCLPTADIVKGQGPAIRVRTRMSLTTEVVLGHRFNSEVILLAVDMPDFLDAPMMEPSGMAVWYSFGTLMAEAAARYLHVSPDEVQVGVRPDTRSLRPRSGRGVHLRQCSWRSRLWRGQSKTALGRSPSWRWKWE